LRQQAVRDPRGGHDGQLARLETEHGTSCPPRRRCGVERHTRFGEEGETGGCQPDAARHAFHQVAADLGLEQPKLLGE
jgi:hypothetical protein